MLWYPAYVGIGSNLDDPPAQVQLALDALTRIPQSRLLRRSSLFGSRPMGPVLQPDYVNAAAGLLTRLGVLEFFAALGALETALGRTPGGQPWGPRRIDLDLLIFANQRLDTPQLRLPHPGIAERNFVLYPLGEVAPELFVPGLGRVADLAARVTHEGIWRLPAGAAAPASMPMPRDAA